MWESVVFPSIEGTHQHEEKLRSESLALISASDHLIKLLEIIQTALELTYAFTLDHVSRSEDETTMQLLGIRLFNSAASGIKLALSGYYQTALHQARDIMELGFLLDFFRTFPEQRGVWKRSDSKTRQKLFAPVKIRDALDKRDQLTTKRRAEAYGQLSELASHATFRGFRLTTRGGLGELGPFVDGGSLAAWLEEMALRLGPTAIMYANQFPDPSPELSNFFQQFGSDLLTIVRGAPSP